MTNISHQIIINDLLIEIIRKPIKNLRLGVYPPNGIVRASAPMLLSDDVIRQFVISKLSWIYRQQRKFASLSPHSPYQLLKGESHFFLGECYCLEIIEQQGKAKIAIRNHNFIDLYIHAQSNTKQRAEVLEDWYRQQFKALIPELLDKWQAIAGVEINEWGVKKMKTKWGTCNITDKRVWLNLDLITKPVHCIEYVLLHELVHLHERLHNNRFKSFMDRFMPQWRIFQDELNHFPSGERDRNDKEVKII